MFLELLNEGELLLAVASDEASEKYASALIICQRYLLSKQPFCWESLIVTINKVNFNVPLLI
jgi:hypothetical protein